MRALLIVNPHATSTTRLRRDVIEHALASQLELDVVETRYRGHAATLAGKAARDGYELVLTLGGDGTVNEAVNGLVRDGGESGAGRPALATLPAGQANVFTRALGLPADPVDATGRLIEALRTGRHRDISLGRISMAGTGDRYFTFNAGLGLDAEVVRMIEGLRARGRVATPRLYVWTALRQYYMGSDRRNPALTVERDGQPSIGHLFFALISNATPWTYLGRRPVNPSPAASFETGLDLFALRRMRTVGTLSALRQVLTRRDGPPRGKDVLNLHDEPSFTLRSARPIAVQVDGEYMGEHEYVRFRAVPHVLRVIA